MADFDVQGARAAGYSDSDIAQHLAQQNNFDYSSAKNEGYGDHEIISHLTGTVTAPQEDASTTMAQSQQMSPMAVGAGTGAATLAGKSIGVPVVNRAMSLMSPGPSAATPASLERYLNSQLQLEGQKGTVALKDFGKKVGMPVRTQSEVQDALAAIKAKPAIPAVPPSRVPVIRNVNGVPTTVAHTVVPGVPEIPAKAATNLDDIAKMGAIEKYLPASAAKYIAPVAKVLGGPLAAAGTAASIQSAINRWPTDKTGAVISGLEAVGSGMSPFLPEVGVPLALAATGANYLRDKYNTPTKGGLASVK